MGRLSFMFLGIVVGGGAIFGEVSFHVLQTNSGLQLVPKRSASLSDTYVDIRKFSPTDWASHPTLSADIVAAEKSQIMGQSTSATIKSGVRELLNEVR